MSTTPTTQGLALCPDATQGIEGTRVGPGRIPTVHPCPKGQAVGGPIIPPHDTGPNIQLLTEFLACINRCAWVALVSTHLVYEWSAFTRK